ncbi:Gfo/Idh/MocA family oxidoreductase [Micromonospora sp. BRA006-A]|nr:Gfo/Idh/MocA family oxidoreductase [Micromonospora sp. BRA006-A]
MDAVDICTPPNHHVELEREALAAGLHVICAKPVAVRTDEALDLIDLARDRGLLLYPAHNYGFSPMMRVLTGAVAGGRLGGPLRARFRIARDSHARGVPGWQPDWRRDISVARGGIMLDHGTHCAYMATQLFGEAPRTVSCVAQWADGDAAGGMDVAARLDLEFGDGGTCEIDLSWVSDTRSNRYLVSGPDGAADVHTGWPRCVRRTGWNAPTWPRRTGTRPTRSGSRHVRRLRRPGRRGHRLGPADAGGRHHDGADRGGLPVGDPRWGAGRAGRSVGRGSAVTAGEIRLSVAIMHHPRRRERIPPLVRDCALTARVVTDPDPDGVPSPLRTAKVAWRAVADGATHHLVLQDDIRLIRSFATQVHRAIAARPEHGISLYSHWDSPQNSYLVRRAVIAGWPFAPLSLFEWTPPRGSSCRCGWPGNWPTTWPASRTTSRTTTRWW